MNLIRTRLSGIGPLLLIAVIGLAACAPPATSLPPTSAPTSPPAATPAAPTLAPTTAPTTAPPVPQAVSLQVAQNAELGSFLADGEGRTLYLFTKDVPGTSNCYEKCAQAWPAVVPAGKPEIKGGVTEALIGTTQRTDGTTQLTYNGWPLYYFAKDAAPGDTTGQAVGNVWWVISAEGNPVKPAALQLAQNDALGKFLGDDAGRTLYIFTKDSKDTTVCYDKCEQAWPPLLMLGAPTLGDGLDATLIGSVQRKDGTLQVTYNGWPLYYFAKDAAPGDTTGQAVGNVWWVISAEGNPIKPAALQLTQNDALGKFLGDDAGRTLYIFTKDSKDTTVCYDKCEQAWPPLLMLGEPTLGGSLDAALVGSVQRKDGTLQVTYNGWPLYYYAKDAVPGDTTGQGVGDVWYVIGPDGTIQK